MRKTALYILSLSIILSCSCGRSAVKPGAPSDHSLGEPNSPPREPTNIDFAIIPGGIFSMGDVEKAGGPRGLDEIPVHSVMITGFEMSVNQITNSQYAQYLNEALETGDISADEDRVRGQKGPYRGAEYIYLAGTMEDLYPGNRCWIVYRDNAFSVADGKERFPVVYVTWYGARAFARHYGLDLPTEAEWEYASRGGVQYMYGTDDGTISHAKANYSRDNEPAGQPVNVRSYPPNPFGLHEMSGNVWEWCLSRYGPYSSQSVMDPLGPSHGVFRVTRGGSWNLFAYHCRAADRNFDIPAGKADYLGFRVVRLASKKN